MKQDMYLKKNRDFQQVYQKGRSFANRMLVMYVVPTGGDKLSRIGISVSRKVGNSVVRHRVCRSIREIFRLNRHRLRTGTNIVVVAREAAGHSDYNGLEGAFLHLCGLHNIRDKD